MVTADADASGIAARADTRRPSAARTTRSTTTGTVGQDHRLARRGARRRRRAGSPRGTAGATSTGRAAPGRRRRDRPAPSVTSTLRASSVSGLNTTTSTVRPRPPMSATEGGAIAGGEARPERRRQLPGARGARRGAGRHRPLVQQHALDHHRLPVGRADDGGVGHAGHDALLAAVVDDLVPAGSDAEPNGCGARRPSPVGTACTLDIGPLVAGVVDRRSARWSRARPGRRGDRAVLGRRRRGAGRRRLAVGEHPLGAGDRRSQRQRQALGAQRAVVLLQPLGDHATAPHPERGGHLVGPGHVVAEVDAHDASRAGRGAPGTAPAPCLRPR